MAVLGYNTIGASQASQTGGVVALSGPYPITEDGTVTDLYFYAVPGSSDQHIRLCLYVDSAGSPGNLVAVTAEILLPAFSAAGWVHGPASGSLLNGQSYWVGPWTNEGSDYKYDTGTLDYKAITYSSVSNPTSPFGTPDGSVGQKSSAYVAYTPAKILGYNTIGAAAWDLDPVSYIQVSGPYTMTEDGTVTSVKGYLRSAAGSAAGRFVIWKDGGGPNVQNATIVGTSDEYIVTDTSAGSWVPANCGGSLTNGASYYVGIWFGATSPESVQFRSDTPGGTQGYYNQPFTYASTGDPSSPWPASSFSSTEKLSVYAIYTPAAVVPPGLAQQASKPNFIYMRKREGKVRL